MFHRETQRDNWKRIGKEDGIVLEPLPLLLGSESLES